MLESTDILYIVIAFCILWITAFVCWFIYQVATVFKRVNDVLGELKYQIEKVEQALNGIKSKFDAGSGHLSKLTGHVKKFTDGMKGKGKEKR